jgi:hypothetical protein
LLIFALNEVYGYDKINYPTINHGKTQGLSTGAIKCVNNSESNSICSVMGGKSRRKTKYRKTRKNKLSKKTHRRSRK